MSTGATLPEKDLLLVSGLRSGILIRFRGLTTQVGLFLIPRSFRTYLISFLISKIKQKSVDFCTTLYSINSRHTHRRIDPIFSYSKSTYYPFYTYYSLLYLFILIIISFK